MASTRKKKNLVIVESPAKAKTINKYLGPDFEVVACKGHVRDLPKSGFGINIDEGWIPTYLPLKEKGKKELLDALKKQAAKADLVYLAPDPDREGEAIAWHLKEFLGLDDDRLRRVTFNEITKTAVQKAFTQAGTINMDRVAAQEARRFLDRVVGYKLSPLLSRKLAETLSAGRVQSVAVRLIVDREREIQNFKPEEYWKITALLAPQGLVPQTAIAKLKTAIKPKLAHKPEAQARDAQTESEDGQAEAAPPQIPAGSFMAELAEWAGKKFGASKEDEAMAIVKALEGATYTVSKV
ncbi:MAG TPA: DNA topoisomerase, partial [Gemmataceae bacterium]|nr:DNA topoisomerase [Gemmataceae bacterium]